MYHYVNAVTNTKGDALIGYYVKAVDAVTGSTASLYADNSSTPIVSVSGVANAALVDSDGNASFYIAGGEYHLDIYATDSTTFVRRISNVPMVDFTVAAGNVASRATLEAKSATAGDAWSLTESGREGTFVYSSSDLSTQVTNDPAQAIYVPPSSDATGASGAFVRRYSNEISVKWFGATGDGSTDDTTAIQRALNYANYLTGATIYFPEGTYKITAYLTVYPYTKIRGAGIKATKLTTAIAGGGGANAHENLRNGCIFHSVQAINSSTRANIVISDLWLHCSNGANVGAGYYDRGGTYIHVSRVRVDGFKYGIVFDQSELADIDLCDFENQVTGGVWLVNAADLNAGASTEYTNRISISRCQFNQGASAYGIIDDGGDVHSFTDNNYNGCLHHIRAAGVTGFKISGGEFESAAAACIRFESTTLAGTGGVGSCTSVWLGGGAMLSPAAAQNAIIAFALANIVIDGVQFSNSSAVKFNGTANTNAIYAFNVMNGGGGATFDGRATNHFETGYNGTDFKTRTNMPLEMSGTVALDASRNATLGTVSAGGKISAPASASGAASLNLPHGSAPSSPANGDIWTTSTAVFARINGATVQIPKPFRGAMVHKAADQLGANYSAGAVVAWDSETNGYDTDAIHDTVTNNSRLTVPSGVTKVRLGYSLRLSNATAASTAQTFIQKNGSASYTGIVANSYNVGGSAPFYCAQGPVLAVTAGDYFEVSLTCSDTSIDVLATSSFWMEIIE